MMVSLSEERYQDHRAAHVILLGSVLVVRHMRQQQVVEDQAFHLFPEKKVRIVK